MTGHCLTWQLASPQADSPWGRAGGSDNVSCPGAKMRSFVAPEYSQQRAWKPVDESVEQRHWLILLSEGARQDLMGSLQNLVFGLGKFVIRTRRCL
jgi:hypothetical protein